ncbi:MAG: hypothetical protein JXR77_10630 [Lentisphaeria bacterium]|nr:hypothetical protein [Lentisphaeria bacterium]
MHGPDWRLLDGDVRSPLLLVEHPRALADEEIAAMLRFAEKGGAPGGRSLPVPPYRPASPAADPLPGWCAEGRAPYWDSG